jgi:hypothetical protein
VTQPLTVALDELRAAAADLQAIATRLRGNVASFEFASVSGDWRAASASGQCGRSVAARLASVIRDLEHDQAALDEAASAYTASDSRASLRMPSTRTRAW